MRRLERNAPWAVRNGKLTWATGFVIACVLPILLVVVLFRHWLGLDNLWAEGQIGIATILGLVGMVGVSIALMALVFYSNRSGLDDQVHDAHDASGEKPEDRTKR
jgi:hypothetical protein